MRGRHIVLFGALTLCLLPVSMAWGQEPFKLEEPRFILNRSLFLAWDQATPAGFQSYYVHASTIPGFTPQPSNQVAARSHVELHYLRLRGLQPETRYYFRVRAVRADGTELVSNEVTAQTIEDGNNERRVPTLMYHNVKPRADFSAGYDPGGWISTENLRRDLAYLKAHNVNAVTHQEIMNRALHGVPLPPNPVFLTFDDGFVNYLEHAVPILMEFDYQSVNAIVTQLTGQWSYWAVPEWPLLPLMTWEQIRECQRLGMWMGSHTQTHVDLDREPHRAHEIEGSRNDLIAQLHVHPEYFCYPWGMGGRQNRTMIDRVESAGFSLATRTWPPAVANVDWMDAHWFPRVFINQNDNLRDFLIKLDLYAVKDTSGDGIPNGKAIEMGLDPNVRSGRLPYHGEPFDLSSPIEVEDFDFGGAGVAYYDATAINQGGAYRPFEAVDMALDPTASNGVAVGWTQAGEWLTYSLSVATSGYYRVDVRCAAAGAGGGFRFRIDGADVTGRIAVPDTGGWSAWTTVSSTSFYMEAGDRLLRLEMVDAGSSGFVGSFDQMNVQPADAPPPLVQEAFPDGTPHALPGNVAFEHFDQGGQGLAYHDVTAINEGGAYRPSERVGIAADANAESGYTVGWTRAGEWLEYTVDVEETGDYLLAVRVAAMGAGGQFRVRFDGADQTGLIAVPNTGGWNAYRVVEIPVVLVAGEQVVRVEMVQAGSSGLIGSFDWFRLREVPPAPPRTAYPSGVPHALPGMVGFEDFDLGGQGVAYHDVTAINEGGAYRPSEGVGIAADANAETGYVVGWTRAGEWLEYTVDVEETAEYLLRVRLAAIGSGGQFRLSFAGEDKTGLINVSDTGGWNVYQVIELPVTLSEGEQVIRVDMVTEGSRGYVGAFDWFRLETVPEPPPQLAYPAGEPHAIPGLIGFEAYDTGGEGVAYHDVTAINEGGAYRPSEGVGIAADANTETGYVVGWTRAGEWLEYTVDVEETAEYLLRVRLAAIGSGGQFRLSFAGEDKTGLINVPNTGGWNVYQVIELPVTLSEGEQVVRVDMVSEGGRGYVGAFDWFEIASLIPAAGLSVSGVSATWGESSSSVPEPVNVITSHEQAQPGAGWWAVDGNRSTSWTGLPNMRGWWLALVYEPTWPLLDIQIDWAEGSPTNVLYQYSLDAIQWHDLHVPITNEAVDVNYLWLIFPDAGDGKPPQIRNIEIE